MAVLEATLPSMTVGGVKVHGLSDGTLPTGIDKVVDMMPAQIEQLVGGTDNGTFHIPVNNFLIRRADKVIMIDAGAGNTMYPTLGRLPGNLRAAGVDPKDVTHIVITHLHGDHANGLVDDDGKPHYPNAEIVVHEIELDFWTASDGANDPDKVKGNRARTRINLKPYLDRIHRVRGSEQYLDFVPIIAPGHTPGHTCWLLAAPGGGGFMALGDVVHVSAIQISHPDAGMIYDLDKDQAVKSRKRILDMAATERFAIAGAHVNAPGFGHVMRRGASFAFEPAA
ncbi:MAG: MBL fold metallo-hydrolase [Xanthobacteraceae bacterium]|jgi:glyoxylase-like metal-dependent hydrolase (beta-lactamase superfamily II)